MVLFTAIAWWLIPAGRTFDSRLSGRPAGIILISRAAATPTLRAYQSPVGATGITWPQTKFLLTMLPPFSVRAFCGIAGSLFAFALAAGRREKLIPPRDQWLWLLVFAMLNYGLFVVLTTEALVYLTASEAVTITYTLPIWASILAWPMLGERLTLVRIVAILLGCGGVALMVGVGSVNAGWDKLPGAAMGFAAAWLFGLGTVVAKKHPLRIPPAASVAWQGAIGTVPVLVLAR